MRILSACVVFWALSAVTVSAAERPNFVWILSEDNSKHYLKLYDEGGAPTPNIARMAEHGLLFEHAFSCAPVCSVARTTLMTGVYAPRLGTQFHRKIRPVRLPDGWHLFPAYLREAGYFTTNNFKEDYNTKADSAAWDDSSKQASWRKRPAKKTPFFHMESHSVSHESSLHFTQQQMDPARLTTDPASVSLAPYHPDTPLFRYTHAHYLDRIRQVDEIVAKVLRQLETAGVLEDTFVFYFGDHGGVLPRSKGYLYESGLHVPLVIRVPKNWQHLIGFSTGSRVKGFVDFVDLGPTVLHLAGVPVSEHFDGQLFLGKGVSAAEVNQRDEAFGYADRFDEKYDLSRSLRKGHYKYIRNYQPFYPDSLQNNYRYRMLAYAEWRKLHHNGGLNNVRDQFFQPKPAEALYDLNADPHETRNLAGDPQYAETLTELRKRLADRVKNLPDLSFYPESVLVERAIQQPIAFGKEHADEIARLVDVADLSLLPFDEAKPRLLAALKSPDPWQRYWALIACSSFGQQAKPLIEAAKSLQTDDELLVRVRAAEFLALVGAAEPQPVLEDVLRQSESPVVSLLTLNTVAFLRDTHGHEFDLSAEDIRAQGDGITRRLEYLSAP